MSRIDGRLDRLERIAGVAPTASTCATCGRILRGPNKGRIPEGEEVKVVVRFGDDGADDDMRCAACGALTGLRIEFDKAG